MSKFMGLPLAPSFAERLGLAEEKKSQQQMTHTRSSTQDTNVEDVQKKAFSLTWPTEGDVKAASGSIDPNKVAEMGADLLSTTPAGVLVTRGQKLFRFTSTGGTEFIPGLGKVLREITPDFKAISRRFADPGEEFGTHVGTDRSAAEYISREQRGFVDESGMLTMASKVDKPYWVEDTGGTWNPDQVIHALTNRVGPNLDNMPLKDKGRLSKPAIEQLYKIQRDYKNYKEAWGKEEGILSSIAKPGMKQEDYVAALDTKYNKQIQEVLKKEGFDHLSYINTREGNPVESAILFDRTDVDLIPPKSGLSNISTTVEETPEAVMQRADEVLNSGWKRLPSAAGKRDSDPRPTFLEQMYKKHPDLVKSKPSELEQLEIALRRKYNLPEEELQEIMRPLWTNWLNSQDPVKDKAKDNTYKNKMIKTTEADPMMTMMEKLTGLMENLSKPKTVIRDEAGRITGVA